MADRADLLADIGETFTLQATWTQPNGAPVDLTGYTASLVLSHAGDTTRNVVTYAGTISAPATGVVVFTVPAATTAAWTWNTVEYKVVMTAPGGATTRLFQGLLGAVRGVL